MLVRLSTLGLTAALLCGCQSMGAAFSNAISNTIDWVASDENTDQPRELKDLTPEVKLLTLWSKDVGKGDGGNQLGLGLASGKLGIYTADYTGSVTALDLTGKQIFKVEVFGQMPLRGPLSAGPTLLDEADLVVLGTSEGEVVGLSATSGKTLWTAKVPGEILAPPAVSRESVILLTSDGAVFALSADGKLLWSLGRHSSPLSLRGSSSPKILPSIGPQGEDLVLVGFANGKMALLELSDGKVFWEKQLAAPFGRSELEQLVDIDSTPVVDGETFFVSAFYGGVIASSLSGEVLWRNEDIIAHQGPRSIWPNAPTRRLFVTDVKGDIWSLDKSTGRAYWKQDLLHQRQPTAPVVYGDFLAVGDYKGYVHLLAQEDGREVARARVSRHPIRVDPLVVEGILLVLASDGSLSALKVEP